MDRSLKLRTLALVGMVVFCIATLAPSFIAKDSLPSWFQSLFSKQISMGLDLQGGKHIVYNIDLDKAVDDKASEIKRDLEARMADDKLKGSVKTPATPLGAVTVILDDGSGSKKADLKSKIDADYNDREHTIEWRDCTAADGPNALCFLVSSSYADGIKKAALTNAVATIRERINEKGVAEPSVVEKGDDIIVELPGDPKSQAIIDTEELIARTAKLEMKVVDDCSNPTPSAGLHGRGHAQRLAVHEGAVQARRQRSQGRTRPSPKRSEARASRPRSINGVRKTAAARTPTITCSRTTARRRCRSRGRRSTAS